MDEPTFLYLEADDELTTAAERLRSADGTSLVLVLPAGSAIATSRINFRLLAREAGRLGRRLAIVSPERSTLALAESAGLAAHASVVDAETASPFAAGPRDDADGRDDGEARDGGRSREDGGPRGGAGLRGTTGIRGSATALPEPTDRPLGTSDGRPDAGARGARGARGERSGSLRTSAPGERRSTGGARRVAAAVAVVAALAGLAVAGIAAATLLLPSATVEVTIRASELPPIEATVVADPAATAADPAAGIIPATIRTFPLAASGTFAATGIRVEETPARGSVRWQNCDPTRAYTIPGGTSVRTASGIAFLTDESVFLPVAILTGQPPRITCQLRDVTVVAAIDGTTGNVAAAAIDTVPGSYNSVVLRVSNPLATAGGTRVERPQVTAEDVAAALATLEKELDVALEASVAAAVGEGADDGALVFEATATRDAAIMTPGPDSLVGTEVERFELSAASTGSVLAVDPAIAGALVEGRLEQAIPAGSSLVPGTRSVEVGEGRVVDGRVAFPVRGTASVVRVVDPAAVRAAVAGRGIEAARAAAGDFGAATVVAWPDWVTTLPVASSDRLVVTVAYEGIDGTPLEPPASP
ncbi:MAG: hypothetical protein RL338_33 [Chloroflexota bacterium]